jgi:chromosomal replication initiator protein
MQNLKENWNQVLDTIGSEVTTVTFDLYIKTLEPLAIKDNCLIILANSETAKKRCMELCSSELKLAIADNFDVDSFKIIGPEEQDDFSPAEVPSTATLQPVKKDNSIKFNPKYTFDSFVVGKSNDYVYAACRAVAENPGAKFNPLFIYGGVGLGKTHLMHAIGNYLKQNSPELNVIYVTCEKFTNDYIDSIRGKDKSISSFREKYRNVDVLMIDDVQFISNKTETQEEFFHTFNDLYQNNKQIVIASDRPPKEIATLSDRLVSRLANGLIQDIQSPDFETRVAILKRKAAEENYNIDEAVFSYLAEKIDTNIRELEGYLAKVHFYAGIHCKHFASLEDAEAALKDVTTEKEAITADDVINAVCKYYNVNKADITSKKRNKEVVDPRQVAIYLITELIPDLPLTSIGKSFGDRDHTTIMHARDKIAGEIKTNVRTKTAIVDIKDMILKK